MSFTLEDTQWMRRALSLAEKAEQEDEVPVGAILILDNRIIGEGHNLSIQSNDPTAHAEIVCLRDAGCNERNYRLPATTLYVTLEPCIMCVGALIQARVARVVFATPDPRAGVLISCLQLMNENFFNHKFDLSHGCLQQESALLLKTFFKNKRQKKRTQSVL